LILSRFANDDLAVSTQSPTSTLKLFAIIYSMQAPVLTF